MHNIHVAHTSVQWMLINPPQFVFKVYGGLTSLADQLDNHWYLYIILVLEIVAD